MNQTNSQLFSSCNYRLDCISYNIAGDVGCQSALTVNAATLF